jgi:[ribosomal protein S5]-alanine N-acetyltransferase
MILSHFKFESIESERLLLREISSNDDKDIFRLYSDEDVLRYTDNDLHKTLKDSQRFIEENTLGLDNQELICWGITLKPKKKIIGTIRLDHIDWKHNFATMGNLLDKSLWNRGIMTEAQRIVTEFAFRKMNLHRIEAQVYIKNIASCRTFEKLNYKREGVLRENFLIKEKYCDSVMYSMLNHEFMTEL